jgi:hypothetical protein
MPRSVRQARRVGWWLVIAGLLGLVTIFATSTVQRHRAGSRKAEPVVAVDRTAWCVDILNGNGRKGEAREVASRLRSAGFSVETVGNAERFDYPRTLVLDRKGNRVWADDVARMLGDLPVVLQRTDGGCAIQVILGHDWSQ